MPRKNAFNEIENYAALFVLVLAAGMLLDMIPDDSPFAGGKAILVFVLSLLKPDILPYIIGIVLAVIAGRWYMQEHGIRLRIPRL